MPGPDHRDDATWVVVELTEAGEKGAEEGVLDANLRRALDVDHTHPFFLPYAILTRYGRKSVVNVIQGYAFVATGLPETTYLSLPTKTPFVRQVIHRRGSGGLSILTPVPDASVRDLRRRLRKMIAREIEVDARVQVVDGLHRGVVGSVLDVVGDDAIVLVDMRSLKAVRVFPRFSLRPAEGVLGFNVPSEIYPSYPDDEGKEGD